MATNQNFGSWRVKVTSIPPGIRKEQLADSFNIPCSRIYIPPKEKQMGDTNFAWIHEFQDEQDARRFVDRNSHLIISNVRINCEAFKPVENDPSRQYQPPIINTKPPMPSKILCLK